MLLLLLALLRCMTVLQARQQLHLITLYIQVPEHPWHNSCSCACDCAGVAMMTRRLPGEHETRSRWRFSAQSWPVGRATAGEM